MNNLQVAALVTSLVLSSLLIIKEVLQWFGLVARPREQKIDAQIRTGAFDREETVLRVPAAAIRIRKKEGDCYVPGWGRASLTKEEVLEARKQKRGFEMRECSGVQDAEDYWVPVGHFAL